MRKFINKKGQVGAMAPAILTLVVAGIILVLGVIILQEMRDTDTFTKAISGTVSNEVITTVTETGENLAKATAPAGVCTVTAVTNSTSATAIPSTNYTATNCNVKYSSVGNGQGFNNSNWNVTYTYTEGDEAYRGTNDTIVGLGSFGDFWTIIVLAIVASIVIGLILMSFGGKKAR